MAAYPLNKLLNLRHDREERARREVVQQRRAVTEQEQAVAAAERTLADFTGWRVAEERRLFAEVRDQALNSADLDVLKHEIASLRQQQAHKKQDVEDAERELQAAREALAQRIKAMREAQHNRRKLEGHMGLWTEEERLARTRREEHEADETTSMRVPGGGKP
ncbi:type III secretion system stalk subunit SctO [Acanthopleuribacter pedis]|uniref:YscO family type III secretion system apparatus protein n=1 Tax=Acanthopleuribacter pedis TaxID=442870 RepID=A0A8J7QE87_9BACT|nr:YscO family type III secretion system apparatus protein [Acanthopleuribacter pedis]MBO1322977.1 YscO family type III secretion system apparatus protein [Acanthopleuribacter pedis]